jgi:TolB-like protein/DNA-binding winged helix-turn-helix (wHTH) protein/Tfp pilus assembly protein PilF
MSDGKLRFDGWVLDPESGDLERGGARIRLQEQSTLVLKELIAHAGSVVTREHLIALLWPKGIVDFDTGLNTTIRKLRSALGDETGAPRYIETLPRRGYRFVGTLDAAPDAPTAAAASAVGSPAPMPTPAGAPTAHARASAAPGRSRNRTALVAACVVGLGIVGFAADRLWFSYRRAAATPAPTATASAPLPATAAPTIPVKSVAVLPFLDMSEKKDQEYLSDGLSEELIDVLTNVPELRVPARTSSFYFKGKQATISDIAKALSVAHVLEGSVRKSGNHLRVTAQLVRADNGYHLWSQTYDRDLHDIFKVQDDIANAVVQALQISLMGGPLTRQKGGTQNLEAYLLYLRSIKEFSAFSATALKEARKHAEQAIKLDPNFILAWTTLGYINTYLAQIRELPLRDGYERARQLGQHALQLNPDLIEAHLLLGYIHRTYDWDWAAAQSEVRQALALDPKDSGALLLAGQVSAALGHWDDAVEQLRASLVRDPLCSCADWQLATTLYRAGRFVEAEVVYRKLIELEPGYAWAHEYLAKTLLAEGKPEAALAMAQQEGAEADRLDVLPIVLQAAGRQAEADAALQTLISKFADRDAYYVAMNYAYRDDHDLALHWLERAYNQKAGGFVEILGEPLFANLANDSHYKALLRKMNLPE